MKHIQYCIAHNVFFIKREIRGKILTFVVDVFFETPTPTGLGVAAALPGVPQGGEVRGPDPQGHRAADGAVQHLRRLAQDHLLLHGFLEAHPHPASSARQPGSLFFNLFRYFYTKVLTLWIHYQVTFNRPLYGFIMLYFEKYYVYMYHV